MDKWTLQEEAYKRGYERGYADALAFGKNELKPIKESVKECLQRGKALTVFATDNNVGDKWIPVSERTPKNFISVLGYMTDAVEFPPVRECYTVGNAFYFPTLRDVHPVSHWMPMPEPPKEGE